MLSRESQLAWAAAPLGVLCPQECVDLANDSAEGACPQWSLRPFLSLLALFQARLIALVEPSLSTRRDEEADWKEKNVPFSWAVFQQILNFHISRSRGVLLSVSLEVWSKIPVVTQLLL